MSRSDLEDERRFLLDSLRDLEREHEKGEIDEGDYLSLREDYTARAADVLRAIEDIRASRRAGEDVGGDERPDRSRQPRGRRVVAWVLIGGMLLLAGASLSVLLGGGRASQTAAANTPAEQLALAHQYEGQGRAVDALKLYDAVLKKDPGNVEALTYRGWLLKLAGLVDQAQAALDKAVAVDPAYPDAHFFRGMLLYQDRKDPAAAIPELEAFLASNPPAEVVGAVQGVLDRARNEAAPPTTAGG